MTEVYNSSTHGRIPLSFTGRHLLQNLRKAISEAISNEDWHYNNNAVSQARGELARYMSDLELRKLPDERPVKYVCEKLSDEQLLQELLRRDEIRKEESRAKYNPAYNALSPKNQEELHRASSNPPMTLREFELSQKGKDRTPPPAWDE